MNDFVTYELVSNLSCTQKIFILLGKIVCFNSWQAIVFVIINFIVIVSPSMSIILWVFSKSVILAFIGVKNEGPMYIIFVGNLRFIRRPRIVTEKIRRDVFKLSDFGNA